MLFLHEGKALQDFFHPDRIIVGIDKPDEFPEFNEIFSFYITNNIPVLYTDTKTAELLKYVNNAVAAMKISFMKKFWIKNYATMKIKISFINNLL